MSFTFIKGPGNHVRILRKLKNFAILIVVCNNDNCIYKLPNMILQSPHLPGIIFLSFS